MAKRQPAKRPAPRVLDDPRAIRALAHPARLAAIDALGGGVELTATQVAEAAGITPSAMSYHLRALEKWGIVERVESSEDGRERPWRAYPGGFSIEAMPTAAAVTATSYVTRELLGRVAGELAAWYKQEDTQPKAWQRASGLMNRQVWLTAEEVLELREMVESYVDERTDRSADEHPAGAQRTRVTTITVGLLDRGSGR